MGSFPPPPVKALSPGDRLDRYELLSVLAQGGMGTVWLARMTGKHGFERLVALKTILPAYSSDRQFSNMFLDEARIAAQIDHENVVRILDIGEDQGVLYHAMELIDGESLRKLYRDVREVGAPFPLAVALRIAADTCAGLHAVHQLRGSDGHSLDVVHRDVSPQNIIVTVRGTIKLIDFGVAKARARRTEDTTAGTLKGKIEYMAPEQARGERIDRRADVYSIGAVLYELLQGEPVRSTDAGRQLLALHELMIGAPYEPLRPSIPLPVRTLVDRALSRDPQLRYGTTEDMRHALEQAMVTIGHRATADDVANVLAHFSRERTIRRKEAIETALRSSQALERSMHTASISERDVTPASARSDVRQRTEAGPQPPVLQVVGTATADPGIGITVVVSGEEPNTGPSMPTMQGASLSDPRPPPTSSAAKVFAAFMVLALVSMLGVVAVVGSRNRRVDPAGSTPTSASSSATDATERFDPKPVALVVVASASAVKRPSEAPDAHVPSSSRGVNDAGVRAAASTSAALLLAPTSSSSSAKPIPVKKGRP